tara:strand:- start:324 stop:593 length:270 start_codon:yes stop_codon:yes gene_type:complete
MKLSNPAKNYLDAPNKEVSHIEHIPEAVVFHMRDKEAVWLSFDSTDDQMDFVVSMVNAIPFGIACDYFEKYPAMMRGMRNLVKVNEQED